MRTERIKEGIFVEFLPIGDAKLKIVLNSKDLSEYKLDLSSVDGGGEGAKRGIWQILDCARDRVGFDPCGDKILIQFYPTKEGGCEIFVTKLGILPDASAKLVAKSERVTMISRKRNFYRFEAFEDLSAACREIERKTRRPPPESDVYFDGSDFYLAINEYGIGGESCEYPCIFEFGNAVTSERGIHLTEHCEILIEKNAVKVLSEL